MSDIKSFKEHWENIEVIAKAGQGTTIKALNHKDKNTISAVKILNRQGDTERRRRMFRETVALSTLGHPNLPKVLDTNTEFWGDLNYKLFIATEFIPILSDFVLSRLNFNEKINLIIRISEVIDFCHNRGIVHRDIKPDNIILKNNSFANPIILDFGISFNFNESDDDNLTPDGQHLGNRFLILPEQKVGEAGKRDFRTDVTCLVGIFYYILCDEIPVLLEDENGRKPHQRPKAKVVIDELPKHIKILINNFFDVGFSQLIDKRWQTVKSLIDQFHSIKNSNASEIESLDSDIRYIKSITNTKSYQNYIDLQNIRSEATRKAKDFRSEIIKQLGEGWRVTGYIGGDSRKYINEGYDTRHSFKNSYLNIIIDSFIKSFITGNELVIHSLVELKNGKKSIKEVFRQPILGEKNWKLLEAEIKSHYITIISKEVQNIN